MNNFLKWFYDIDRPWSLMLWMITAALPWFVLIGIGALYNYFTLGTWHQ